MVATLAMLLLSVQVQNQSTVSLAWDANTAPNIQFYVVQQAQKQGGPYGGDLYVNGNTITAQVSNLTLGATYYFVVSAIDDRNLWSAKSNEVSITMPVGPTADQCAPITGKYAVSVFPTFLLKTGSKGPGSRTRFDYQVASPNSPITSIIVGIDGAPASRQDGKDLTNSAGQWFGMPPSGSHDLTLTASNDQGCTKTVSFGQLVVP